MGSIHGYEVSSGLPLTRLSHSAGARGEIEIEFGPSALLDRTGELTAWHEMEGLQFALARADGVVLGWCSVTGAFEADPAAGRVRVCGASLDDAWEHRMGTTAVPLLASLRSDLAIHASAVQTEAGAVLLCGPSGRGKSTLALMGARLGHRVVTEDGAVISLDGPDALVWPGPRGVRVDDRAEAAVGLAGEGAGQRPDVRQRRLRSLQPDMHALEPLPVVAVCNLAERGPQLEVTRLGAAEALPGLAPNLIHAGGTESLRPAFARLAALLERAPAFSVTMPDLLDEALPAARSLLARVAA